MFPLKLLVPLILTLIPEPGAALFCITCTPDARPCKSWSTEFDWVATSSLTETDDIEPEISFFKTVPYPITTTSSSSSVSTCIFKVNVGCSETSTSSVAYPT